MPQNKRRLYGCLAIFAFCVFGGFAVIWYSGYCFCGGSREKARLASCASNEHQIVLALIMYANEYDDTLPSGLHNQGIGWAGQASPYFMDYDRSVWLCPDDPTTGSPNTLPISYGYNANCARRRVKLTSLAHPAQTILVFEVTGAHADLSKDDEDFYAGAKDISPIGDGTDGSLFAGSQAGVKYATGVLGGRPIKAIGSQFSGADGRHSGGSNFAFADGHVKWFKPENVSSGADAAYAKAAQTGTITGHASGTDSPSFHPTFSTK